MKLPKALLIDLDNTLYPSLPCHTAGLRAATVTALERGLSFEQRDFPLLFDRWAGEVRATAGNVAASHEPILYFQRLVEDLRGSVEPELVLSLNDAYWENYLKTMVLDADVVPLLVSLKERGIKLAIVTNLTTQIQHKKLLQLGVSGIFDRIVTSEEAGIDKPDPRPFELALRRLEVSRENAWMVGDRLERDVRGALAAGVRAVWYDRERQGVKDPKGAQPDLIISQWSDLRKALSV